MALSNILVPNLYNLYANSETLNNNNANPTGNAKTIWVDQNNKLFFGAQNISDGAKGGTVTSITANNGLTAIPNNPITTTGTISIAPTGVTPGTYTAANITVNQQGQITAANGGFTMTTFVPTFTPVGNSNTYTNVCSSYLRSGNVVIVFVSFSVVVPSGSNSAEVNMTLPITASSAPNPTNGNLIFPIGALYVLNTGQSGIGGLQNVFASNTTTTLRLISSSAIPASTRFVSFTYSYRL